MAQFMPMAAAELVAHMLKFAWLEQSVAGESASCDVAVLSDELILRATASSAMAVGAAAA